MTPAEMTTQRLNEIIAAYGSEPSRWPEAEREAAQAALAAADSTLLREAAALDAALDSWSVAETTPDLAARIVEQSRGIDQAGNRRSLVSSILHGLFGPSMMPQLAGLAAALIIGFGIGVAGLGQSTEAQAQDLDVDSLILGPSADLEWLS